MVTKTTAEAFVGPLSQGRRGATTPVTGYPSPRQTRTSHTPRSTVVPLSVGVTATTQDTQALPTESPVSGRPRRSPVEVVSRPFSGLLGPISAQGVPCRVLRSTGQPLVTSGPLAFAPSVNPIRTSETGEVL